jgi:hypothetical protein
MFEYRDPVGTDVLQRAGALQAYRSLVHSLYRRFGRRPGSGFTIPEAFQEVAHEGDIVKETVSWLAFPRSQSGTAAQIDAERFSRQDEYVEWNVTVEAERVRRIVFTTEFPEYYEALAEVDVNALRSEIAAVTGGQVANEDLFGVGFDPNSATSAARAAQFLEHSRANRWNNGENDILFLTHPSSTLGALFNLVTECAVPKPTVASNAVCGLVSGACVSSRNSDPAVCNRVQQLVRAQLGLTIDDPAGVRILHLQGIWKLAGRQIDINDMASSEGAWQIVRNGRRAILKVSDDLTIGDDPITSGTQVAAKLIVGADVVAAPEAGLPPWAKLGQESSRMLTD